LIDATTGTSHTVLDSTTVPSVHRVPTRCETVPVEWDETTGVAVRSYIDIRDPGSRCLIQLDYGTTAALETLDNPSGAVMMPIEVRGTPVAVWKYTRFHDRRTTFQWTSSPGHLIRLTIAAAKSSDFSDAEVLAIARSVR
jgi:hypothetical protein